MQVPIVSTDCEFGPAEVLDHGQYGTLVSVGDSDAIAEAVLATLRDRPAPADSQWLNKFTLELVTQQYLEAFGLAEEESFFHLIADSV
ncbi:MAG: glycosyltransferase [Cyanobacteria bacterium J06642_9]